ncbi:HTTM domain-containing protein [Leucobacter chinensis]|uniref:HTTM domain-containing protein n=1 Tax=Leucobacter chinensis TaxID=2851010 RepID=UPI001C22DE79|nr:HTTM domain-containing protein [Leucobacter chinensis]
MSETTVGLGQRTSQVFKAVGSLIGDAVKGSFVAIGKLFILVEDWLVEGKKAQYGLAVMRILLGIMVMGVALTNLATVRYTFGPGAAWTGQLEYPSSDFAKIFPFSLVNQASHSSIGITLVLVAMFVCGLLFSVGYRTRLVMIPLFIVWVGFLSINTYVQDQSDNLTRMSLIYLFFTAPGDRWSFDARRREKYAETGGSVLVRWWRYQRVVPQGVTNVLHNLGIVVIIAQLCFVYASGGLFKAGGLPWQNGTAVYDPIMTERFGTWPVLSELATAWGPAVAVATIGTVIIQTSFPFMMLNRFTRIVAIMIILFFHAGIGVLMGLPWFSLSMVALDAIFIRDRTWQKGAAKVRRAFVRANGGNGTASTVGVVSGPVPVMSQGAAQ